MRISFEAGEGKHVNGGVNFMRSTDGQVYAEIAVPDGASEDYGYLGMKDAIKAVYTGAEPLEFWYDGQEDKLADDAGAKDGIIVDVE